LWAYGTVGHFSRTVCSIFTENCGSQWQRRTCFPRHDGQQVDRRPRRKVLTWQAKDGLRKRFCPRILSVQFDRVASFRLVVIPSRNNQTLAIGARIDEFKFSSARFGPTWPYRGRGREAIKVTAQRHSRLVVSANGWKRAGSASGF
jgi:hypothetical protein